MNNKTFAYIDETGNADLEVGKSGASKFFIICAILVSANKQEQLTSDLEEVRKKYFQTGEIKSSGVGGNIKRRVAILNSICDLDFKFYALSIDKERIIKDSGLKDKRTFFKYVNGKLYNLLFKSFLDIHIKADEHGNPEFQESFKKYINKNHKPDLFYKSQFSLVNSENENLVQLADFVAGTIGKVYEGKSAPELNEAYRKFIVKKALSIDEWPTKYQLCFPKDKTTEEYSELIYTYSLAQAENFIENHENEQDDDVRLQVALLRHLVFNSRFIDKTKYITSHQLIDYFRDAGYGEITGYILRSKVIAPLRDSDIIITSSNIGYKIPCNFTDMEEFVERVNSIVKPLLARLGRARKNLSITSKGEIEILKGPNYPHLVDFIAILEKYRKAKI